MFIINNAYADETMIQINLKNYAMSVCLSNSNPNYGVYDTRATLYFEREAISLDPVAQSTNHIFKANFANINECQKYYVDLNKNIPTTIRVKGSIEVSDRTVVCEEDGPPGPGHPHGRRGKCSYFQMEKISFQLGEKIFSSEYNLK